MILNSGHIFVVNITNWKQIQRMIKNRYKFNIDWYSSLCVTLKYIKYNMCIIKKASHEWKS